ncbi:MAG: hypothetical protein WKG03_00685 [Telluria sp.]
MAAEYFGNCQICGNRQKSSEHAIAKHGYTIQHGWQSGACWGSGHKPIQVSCDRIESALENARLYIKTTTAKIAELTAKPLDGKGALYAYVKRTSLVDSTTYNAWALVTIETNEKGNLCLRSTDGKTIYTTYRPTMQRDELIARLTAHHIEWLRRTIIESEESIDYLTDRIAKWKPTDLTLVTPEDRAKEGPKVHFQKAAYGYKHSTACTSSAMAAQRGTGRVMTEDRERVTCTACLKELARIDDLPRLRAEKAEKERQRAIKAAQRDIKEYTKLIKKGGSDTDILHWTKYLTEETALLETLFAAAPALAVE